MYRTAGDTSNLISESSAAAMLFMHCLRVNDSGVIQAVDHQRYPYFELGLPIVHWFQFRRQPLLLISHSTTKTLGLYIGPDGLSLKSHSCACAAPAATSTAWRRLMWRRLRLKKWLKWQPIVNSCEICRQNHSVVICCVHPATVCLPGCNTSPFSLSFNGKLHMLYK